MNKYRVYFHCKNCSMMWSGVIETEYDFEKEEDVPNSLFKDVECSNNECQKHAKRIIIEDYDDLNSNNYEYLDIMGYGKILYFDEE